MTEQTKSNPYFHKEVAEQTCSRCLFDDRIAHIHDDGECEYCKLHNQLESQTAEQSWTLTLKGIRKPHKKYDCLIGISGGIDSSTLLYMATVYWGLRPLVIHYNNGHNSKEASRNMKRLIDILDVDFIMYRVNKTETDHLNRAFRLSGTPDADIPNDIAMAKLMYQTARQYGIKTILNGHCFRTEGSTPKLWTRMDSTYIKSVWDAFSIRKLHNFPLYTFKDQLIQAVLGIRQVRPFHFRSVFEQRFDAEKEMKQYIGWSDYGEKHGENKYTEFVGSYLLPNKFGIDKRIVYLSAKVRSGLMDRNEAIWQMKRIPVPRTERFKTDWFDADESIVPREQYDLFPFHKYKRLIKVMATLKIVPYTFYKKYC